jgi:hypothetical protein
MKGIAELIANGITRQELEDLLNKVFDEISKLNAKVVESICRNCVFFYPFYLLFFEEFGKIHTLALVSRQGIDRSNNPALIRGDMDFITYELFSVAPYTLLTRL